ncbi:hypothetical protein Bca4012_091137 [Brassica carinata]|uniref:Transcription initiation factor TFIID subunit 12 domain-containing protein n=1 Tax=Brassica oleracea var. oleracea TaxID=109376 RepID=A0A0D3AET7_BRAOL
MRFSIIPYRYFRFDRFCINSISVPSTFSHRKHRYNRRRRLRNPRFYHRFSNGLPLILYSFFSNPAIAVISLDTTAATYPPLFGATSSTVVLETMSTTFLIPPSAPASSSSSSLPISGQQRGGMAIGVPASPIPSLSQPPPSAFPGSSGQQYGGSGRRTVGMPEAASNTSLPQQQHQPKEQLQQLRSPQQPLPHPHQPARVQGPTQPHVPQPGNQAKTVSSENEVSDNRILGKRSIHELLQQIDPSEKLDPEVAAILADIAEDFVESLTTDIHKERLAAIKKSVTVTEAANARNPYRHGTANARGGQAKTPAKSLGLHNF